MKIKIQMFFHKDIKKKMMMIMMIIIKQRKRVREREIERHNHLMCRS